MRLLLLGGLARTVKLCAAISITRNIVTEKWLDACELAQTFVDCAPFLLGYYYANTITRLLLLLCCYYSSTALPSS